MWRIFRTIGGHLTGFLSPGGALMPTVNVDLMGNALPQLEADIRKVGPRVRIISAAHSGAVLSGRSDDLALVKLCLSDRYGFWGGHD